MKIAVSRSPQLDLTQQLFTSSWRKDPNLSGAVIDINQKRKKEADLLDCYHSMIRGWDFIKLVGKTALSYSRQTNKPEKSQFLPAYKKLLEFYSQMMKIQKEINKNITNENTMHIKMGYFPNVIEITQRAHLDAMRDHCQLIKESFKAYEKVIGLLNGAGWCTPQMDYFGVSDHIKLAERKEAERISLEREKAEFAKKLILFPVGLN